MLASQPTPLEIETRSVLTTEEAALHLNRKKSTLSLWAKEGRGPITPLRINGIPAWRTDDLRRLLGVQHRARIA